MALCNPFSRPAQRTETQIMQQPLDRRQFLGAVGAAAGGLALCPGPTLGQQKGKNTARGSYALPAPLFIFISSPGRSWTASST